MDKTRRKAIWVYPDRGTFDRAVCAYAKEIIMICLEKQHVFTQEDLANEMRMRRERVSRMAVTLGIARDLRKKLKDKRAARCTAQDDL